MHVAVGLKGMCFVDLLEHEVKQLVEDLSCNDNLSVASTELLSFLKQRYESVK